MLLRFSRLSVTLLNEGGGICQCRAGIELRDSGVIWLAWTPTLDMLNPCKVCRPPRCATEEHVDGTDTDCDIEAAGR